MRKYVHVQCVQGWDINLRQPEVYDNVRVVHSIDVDTLSLSRRLSLSVLIFLSSDIASSRSFSTRLSTAWAAREVFGDLGERTTSRLSLSNSSFV